MGIYASVILIFIFIYTFYTGFNDGANAVATTVATRAVKPRTAVILAALSKFLVPIGIYVIGLLTEKGDMSVAANISGKTLFPQFLEGISRDKAFIFMLTAMLGTFIWGLVAYLIKMPISTSHTLMGGIIGSGIAAFGFNAVQWKEYVLVYVILMVVFAPVIGLVFSYILMKITKRIARKASKSLSAILIFIQRINIIVLAGSFASNNAQKGLGIFMMMGLIGLSTYDHTPFWVVLLVAAALTAGMLLGGYRVINTLGRKIFKMQDVHSVVAQLTTSAVMLAANEIGISISTGQVMSSSIMGVGAAERASSVKWYMAMKIAVSWFLTLPLAAVIGGVFYWIIGKLIMGL